MFRIGLLGASKIAPKAIITPARAVEAAVVQAVAARSAERAKAYAAEHGIAQFFGSYEEIIASDEIDVIYNGLPPSHHARWSIAALQAGKHVICEKPIAMNVAEATAMVKATTRTARLAEAFHTAYHSSFEACRVWLERGRIGQITSMTAHFGVPLEDDGLRNQYRPQAGGGSMMDMGCYPLQWVDSFAASDVRSVVARAEMAPSGVDTKMDATLSYMNGIEAQISCSMVGPGGLSADLTIHGTEGVIAFCDPLVPYEGGTLQLTRHDGTVEHHTVSTKSTFQFQLEKILAGFASGSPLVTEGDAIIRQQALIDQVYAAAGIGHLRTIG